MVLHRECAAIDLDSIDIVEQGVRHVRGLLEAEQVDTMVQIGSARSPEAEDTGSIRVVRRWRWERGVRKQ